MSGNRLFSEKDRILKWTISKFRKTRILAKVDGLNHLSLVLYTPVLCLPTTVQFSLDPIFMIF